MDRVLSSWKEIATYLGKGVRTVQRWEKTLGLPVHRPGGADSNVVVALSTELSQWMSQSVRPKQSRINTILLVDDDPELLAVTRSLLEQFDYLVFACKNGERAQYVFENGPKVDLLLTDLQMPGISGEELAHRLTAQNPELPVVIYSGYNVDAARVNGMESRKWTFLAKPVPVSELLAVVHAALNGRPSDAPVEDGVRSPNAGDAGETVWNQPSTTTSRLVA